MSIETDIVDSVVAILQAGVPELNYISFDRIKLATSEFASHEMPAVQIWDTGATIKHERGRALVTWGMSLELIMKSEISGLVDQKGLFELRRKIQLALWEKPNLGVPGVIHLVYTANISDLHLLEPYYIARIDFSVMYYDQLTGSC